MDYKNEFNLSEYEKITAKTIIKTSKKIRINFFEKLLKLILSISNFILLSKDDYKLLNVFLI